MYSGKKRVFISLAAALVVAFAVFLLVEMSGSASADCPQDCVALGTGDITFTGTREGYPAPPVLTGPSANHTIHSPNVTFTWDAGQGGPQPTSFRVCVTEKGTGCGSTASMVYSNIPATARSFTPPGGSLPGSKFQGKRLQWSVATCAPGTTIFGGTTDFCSYARVRGLDWALPAPVLRSTTLPPLRPFRTLLSWQAVYGADHYLFCISKPGISCTPYPTDTPDTMVVQTGSLRTYAPPTDQELARFAGGPANWTAAACNTAFGCVYQQQVLPLTFPNFAPPPTPPNLYTPDYGHYTNSRRQLFRWASATGAARYDICISPPGVPCGSSGSYVVGVGNITSYPVNIPLWMGPVGTVLNWTVASCNATGQCAYQQQVRSLTIGPVASFAFNPGILSLGQGASQNVSVSIASAATSGLSATIAPHNSNIAINGQPAGNPAVVTIQQGMTSASFSVQGVQSGSSTITASAGGFRSATMTVNVSSPPSPDFSLTVSPQNSTVVWGESANYQVTVQPQHGYTGTVNIAVCLPGNSGLSGPTPSNPLSVNAGQTATLSIGTIEGGTTPGESTFNIKAGDSSGALSCSGGGSTGGSSSSVPTETVTWRITVQRTQGNFVPGGPTTANHQECRNGNSLITADRVAAGQQAVEFKNNGQRIGNNAILANFWAISPKCRIGYVVHPVPSSGYSTIGLYNLLSPNPPAVGSPGAQMAQVPYPQIAAWFSPDDSLVVVRGPGQQTPGGTTEVLNLWDAFKGTQIAPSIGIPPDFMGNKNRTDIIRVSGNEVEVIVGSSPQPEFWTIDR